MKKKSPANAWNRSGARPVSEVLMDNTTDMQSVSRTRQNSARSSAISHKTTGPSAAAPAGSVEREPRTARQEGRRGPGINAKLRATSENPMVRRVERFALSLLPATSSPIPELQNACAFAPMTRTFRSGSPRTTKRPVMGVCKPAAVCGCALCVGPRWLNAVGVRYSKPWPCIAPVAAKCIF